LEQAAALRDPGRKEDRNILMIYRVMMATNSFSSGSNYIEMAQLLGGCAGIAGRSAGGARQGHRIGADRRRPKGAQHAAAVLVEVARRYRSQRACRSSRRGGQEPGGELSVKLGEVYYGFGDYQNAVTAINAGLQKGSVKHLDEAYVYLGLAQAQLKNIADAKKAFASLKTVPP
jgi:tetratricopeptide (TPR) repeat protein